MPKVPSKIMPFELIHTVVALAFFGVCALAGDILVRTRRVEREP